MIRTRARIRVQDADLRHLLAVTLVSTRRLRDGYARDGWQKTFTAGMAKGKIIAFEMVQNERDNERGHRSR